MWIKQLCNRKVRDFAIAFRARKVPGLSRNGPQVKNFAITVIYMFSHSPSEGSTARAADKAPFYNRYVTKIKTE